MSKFNKILLITSGLTILSLLGSSCAPVELQIQESTFGGGILHGFCAFFATIGKKFGMVVAVYAQNNSGFFYWLGFDIGVFFCVMLMSALLYFIAPIPALAVIITVIYGVFYMG